MGKIFEFTPKAKPMPGIVAEEISHKVSVPSNSGVQFINGEAQKVLISVPSNVKVPDETTAVLVVKALGFYANNGWDAGAKARKALNAMQESINRQAASAPQ
jgi:hypothetical protein